MADTPRIDDLRRRLDREPGSRVFAQLAEELRKAGQLPEAIRVARQGLLIHPGYPSARMTLGRALMDLRDLRGARTEFEAVLRGATDNILASRFLGECLEGLGDLGSALLQYRATLRLVPGDRNLEAQIRGLEQKLTPTATAAPTPPMPSPPAVLRPPVLPREGAIPVLEVDGPMELETSFDKTMAWRPTPPPPVSLTAAESASVAPPAPAVGFVASPPDDSPAVVVGEAGPAEPHVAEAPTAEPAPAEREPTNQSFPDEWEVAEPPAASPLADAPPAASDAPPLSSSTLAELYFNQGFTRQAIDVYRELLEREPGNERIAARILELEALDRELERGPRASTPPDADPKVRRREVLQRTITRLEGLLATVRRA